MSNMETLRCPSCGCADRLRLIKQVDALIYFEATLNEDGSREAIETEAADLFTEEAVLTGIYCDLCSWELTVSTVEEALGYLSGEPDPDTCDEEDES